MPAGTVRAGLNAVIVALAGDRPIVLTLRGERDALPYGPFDPGRDRSLQRGVRRWVHERIGVDVGYLEQLYTFGDRFREVAASGGDALRTISIGYLALVREHSAFAASDAHWVDWYRFFPWENVRDPAHAARAATLAERLFAWADMEPDATRDRRERIEATFGFGRRPWNDEAVLERYELLYEAGLVSEAATDRDPAAPRDRAAEEAGGEPMVFDHRRMVATAISRLRGKIRYRPVIFELLPDTFTLWQMQRAAEGIAGIDLHKGNFRRLVEESGLVEPTGRTIAQLRGRPAAEYRFRREVVHEQEIGLRLRATRTPAAR